MKSHDLAKSLEQLSKVLLSAPNVEITDIGKMIINSHQIETHPTDEQIAVNLRTLVSLSKIDKLRWKNFIDEHNLPIEVKSTYSVRDLLGKILNHLEKHPIDIERIRQKVGKKTSSASELDKAFEIFLGDDFR